MQNILVTGGCGFIGSNFIRYLLAETDFGGRIVNLDKLTYAGNADNLSGIAGRGSQDSRARELLWDGSRDGDSD